MLALTCGDPSGIGPEIALRAWLARRNVPPFFLIGEPDLMAARARQFGLNVPIVTATPQTAAGHFDSALPVVALNAGFSDKPGEPQTANAAGIIESIDLAVALTMSGEARAVVTCPIAKKPLYEAGFKFPGHTEYLAHLADLAGGGPHLPVMLLAGPLLKVAPVTIHIPIAAVPAALTGQLIEETARVLSHDLTTRFGIARPRIAVAGLNPHAGEGGALGSEDDAIIRPAVERLAASGVNAFGPLPADTMFHAAARATYDAALCMYHDQALIPAKALGFDDSVNVTLGLPFIRTSPDHGTAFGIAAQGVARPDSLIAALIMAGQMADVSR